MDPDVAVAATQAQAMLWPQVAAQATEVGMVPTVTCPPDSSMVTGSNPEAQGSYFLWWKCGPWTSSKS